MALLNIQDTVSAEKFSLFVLGFRPFFLAAGIFSIVSIGLWMGVYVFGLSIPLSGLSIIHWHAHEMIYGYTLAVVAGFLLTAVKNWTGVQTIQYTQLKLLFSLWVAARICMLMGTQWIYLAALFDLSFNLWLFIAALTPVVRVKQWKQAGIISKLSLLGISNLLFYLGVIGVFQLGVYWGVFGGLYLLIALVLTMGRRVMPFFIEKGVGYPVKLKNSRLLDLSTLILFLLFTLDEVFIRAGMTPYISAILFFVTSLRLYNWHTPGLWKVPLLWGLYSAFMSINMGFALFAATAFTSSITSSLALHAMAFGGIGVITLSMMSRITLGHTGHDVNQPSAWIALAQWLLVLGVTARVILPIFLPQYYVYLIALSQGLWIGAFIIFVSVNFPLLSKPRIDGAAG
jgi:uncharacterized protein involved in response to NO